MTLIKILVLAGISVNLSLVSMEFQEERVEMPKAPLVRGRSSKRLLQALQIRFSPYDLQKGSKKPSLKELESEIFTVLETEAALENDVLTL